MVPDLVDVIAHAHVVVDLAGRLAFKVFGRASLVSLQLHSSVTIATEDYHTISY